MFAKEIPYFENCIDDIIRFTHIFESFSDMKKILNKIINLAHESPKIRINNQQ